MTQAHVISAAFESFAETTGLPAFDLDDQNRVVLDVGPLQIALSYEEDPVPILWVDTEIGPLGEADEAPRYVLNVGLQAWLGDAMTVALRPDDNMVVGSYAFPAKQVTGALLLNHMQRFVDAAIEIRDRLAAADFPDPEDGGAAPFQPPQGSAGLRV